VARERGAFVALLAALLALVPSHSGGAAESRGGVRLLGTVVSSDAARSLAVIDQGGATRVLHTGGELDGAEVVEIRGDAVLLRRAGTVETLRLASMSGPAHGAGASVPASPAGFQDGDSRRAADSAHAPGSPRAAATTRGSLSRAARAASSKSAPGPAPGAGDAERGNDELLAKLAGQARFAPVMGNDGKLRGVAVMNVVSDSTLESLGLRSDDVITAIQGVPIDSTGNAMNVARGLSWSQPVKLDIERGGLPKVVMIDPGAVRGH
jgi:general secretion pathway protein C